MNILIIDDSEIEREFITKLLNLENLNTITAKNGEEGLRLVMEEDIDLILLDIVMPGMNGYEVCQELKSYHDYKDIPVIFITGNDDIESLQKAFDAGGIDFVRKPVSKLNILARVKVHLENNRLIKSLKKEVEHRKNVENKLLDSNDQFTSQNEELMQIIDQLDRAKTMLEEKDRKIQELKES